MAAPDPTGFLLATPPFDRLPAPALEAAAKAVEIVFFPAGQRILSRGGKPSEHLYVIRKGAVRLERLGQTLQILEDGEIFGFTSLITGKATTDVTVEEDLLAYRIPKDVFQSLLTNASFAGHFAVGLGQRLLKSTLERPQVASFQADLGMPVGELVRRPPVRVRSEVTVGEAARVMREQGIGSVLVDADEPGILTDTDLRNRVLAEGLGPDTPVSRVYSWPLTTVTTAMPVYEAWRMVLDGSLHHLPVTRGGEIVGLVSSTDFLKHTAQGPVAVMKGVERLASRDHLPGYGANVTEMASSLLAGGIECVVIAGFVARLNDTLIARILHWAEADLGPPPVPYSWIAFGSEGRMEQLLLTDQDNALVYAEDTPEARAYFLKLAEKAVADLVAAGFPPCPGGYMATRWQGPLAEWEARFRDWIDRPTAQALLEASIFFDYRRVFGTLPLDRLDAVVQGSRRQRAFRVFLSCLAKSALTFHPPGGLMLRLRGESSRVDLKLQGIAPVVFLARCYGLEGGAQSSNTLERLHAALEAGLIGADAYETLAEAYRFLLRLRLREQIRMASEGRPIVNTLALSDLSSIERSRLKDAFKAVEAWQQNAVYHYQTELF